MIHHTVTYRSSAIISMKISLLLSILTVINFRLCLSTSKVYLPNLMNFRNSFKTSRSISVSQTLSVYRKFGKLFIRLLFLWMITTLLNINFVATLPKGVGWALHKKNIKYNILSDKSIFFDRIFESLFIEVWIHKNKKIIIGNIYRPSVNHPTLSSSEQFVQFIELLTNLLSDFSDINPFTPKKKSCSDFYQNFTTY